MTSQSTQDELYLVDGSGFIFRAYFAMAYGRGGAPMTNTDGVPVGAVYGFTNMILKLLADYHAPYMAVIFDAARKNFRNDIYPAYKANRDETPPDLIPQFPLIREATAAFDIPAISLEGYEADDLIATYTRLAREAGKKVVIVSSDKDLMQLVGDGVRILEPMKNVFVGPDQVMEKFGVSPDKVVDVQSLAGDSSDNVPGVAGIGLKTAAQLINEFGSLDAVLERASEIKQDKRRQTLIDNAENARISRKLVQLDAYAPIPLALEDMKTHDPDKPELVNFLKKQGFNSILRHIEGQIPQKTEISEVKNEILVQNTPDPSQNTYVLIDSEDVLRGWIAEATQIGHVVIDTETTGLTPAKVDLVGISLASVIGRAAYIPMGHRTAGVDDLFGAPDCAQKDTVKQLDKSRVLELLKPMLEDPSVMKIAHNMKYDWQIFARHGVRVAPCDDTMLMSYVLDGSRHSHGMDNLARLHLNFDTIKFEDVAGKGKAQVSFDLVDIPKAVNYAAEDADITLRLYHILKPRLVQEKMVSVYECLERPLIPVIAEMELAGIKVDPVILRDMSAEFAQKIMVLEGEIHALAGGPFNVASPKQIGEVLFGQMGLKGSKKTKTGEWSTAAGVLEKLAAEGHEIVDKILAHRQISKLKSTYTDALQEQINPRTGRVHTSFAMAHTTTGRLASSDPNLQNIPIRTEEGRRIREAFIAEKDHVLLSVDYSQIELRLAAELAGIAALKAAFADGADIHALTASQVFGVPLAEVTPDLRRSAKAVNFGIIYGISGWGLAKQLGCSGEEANDFIKRYLSKFHELQKYMDDKKAEARESGFVRTLYGRKCMIEGIHEKNPAQRGFAERQAINAPLQGTAADIMKLAMIKMPQALEVAGLSARMLLQVHDELVFEVPLAEIEATSALVRSVMESCYQTPLVHISVPLNAEVGYGVSWGRAH